MDGLTIFHVKSVLGVTDNSRIISVLELTEPLLCFRCFIHLKTKYDKRF